MKEKKSKGFHLPVQCVREVRSPKGSCCCFGVPGQCIYKTWELIEILAFIVGWSPNACWVTGYSCCFSGLCGLLTTSGFWSTCSISIKWDLWPSSFLLIMLLYRNHLLRMLHISNVVNRWNLEVVLHHCLLPGRSWYNPPTKFLFSKSVKVYYITNSLLAQRETRDNKWTPAPNSEGCVSTQIERLSNLQRDYNLFHQICAVRAGNCTRKPFLKC